METNNELNAMRRRTSGGMLAAGYRLYTSLFRRLLHCSWPVAIVYALAMALMSSYFIGNIIPLMGIGQIVAPEAVHALWLSTLTKWGLLVLLFAFSATALASYGFSAMRQWLRNGAVAAPQRWYGSFDVRSLWHTAIVVVWLLVAGGLCCAAVAALLALAARWGLTTLYVGSGVLSIVLLILLLPLSFTTYKAVLGTKLSAVPPVKGYISGLGHLGTIAIVAFVTLVVTLLLSVVTQLPAVILYAANIQSQLGALQGDETGMPESMAAVSFVVFFVAGFVQAYVHLSMLFPFFYVYGSVTTEEEEKQKVFQSLLSQQ